LTFFDLLGARLGDLVLVFLQSFVVTFDGVLDFGALVELDLKRVKLVLGVLLVERLTEGVAEASLDEEVVGNGVSEASLDEEGNGVLEASLDEEVVGDGVTEG